MQINETLLVIVSRYFYCNSTRTNLILTSVEITHVTKEHLYISRFREYLYLSLEANYVDYNWLMDKSNKSTRFHFYSFFSHICALTILPLTISTTEICIMLQRNITIRQHRGSTLFLTLKQYLMSLLTLLERINIKTRLIKSTYEFISDNCQITLLSISPSQSSAFWSSLWLYSRVCFPDVSKWISVTRCRRGQYTYNTLLDIRD